MNNMRVVGGGKRPGQVRSQEGHNGTKQRKVKESQNLFSAGVEKKSDAKNEEELVVESLLLFRDGSLMPLNNDVFRQFIRDRKILAKNKEVLYEIKSETVIDLVKSGYNLNANAKSSRYVEVIIQLDENYGAEKSKVENMTCNDLIDLILMGLVERTQKKNNTAKTRRCIEAFAKKVAEKIDTENSPEQYLKAVELMKQIISSKEFKEKTQSRCHLYESCVDKIEAAVNDALAVQQLMEIKSQQPATTGGL